MKNNFAASFDTVAELYEDARPGYPEELYNEIAKYFSIHDGLKILEVGAGDGKATEEIYKKWHPQLTALEPGPTLCRLLRKKFAVMPGVRIVESCFEDFDPIERYDCLVSATAFHWTDEGNRYEKAADALKKKGILVLYWNNYSRNDDPIFDEIQEIYRAYYPERIEDRDIREIQREKIEKRRQEILSSRYFQLLSHNEYIHTKSYTAQDYVNLLKTFSNNSTKSEASLNEFYMKIEERIVNRGNKLQLPIHVNLEIAKRIPT
jgi:SAM-dependent methyltransferase